jgi:hypothetical protein
MHDHKAKTQTFHTVAIKSNTDYFGAAPLTMTKKSFMTLTPSLYRQLAESGLQLEVFHRAKRLHLPPRP